jgi:cytochrome bd ubiquinol oxidase subunit II
MNIAAFWLLAFMLTLYVILDGYDLGVATITPFVARNDDERLASMRSIGPFWNGNEVLLIATGGVLFALFPQAYASSFSGFYLPFIVVLWLLMFRGISLELRSHLPSRIWHDFWDASFFLASVLLALIFGITLGNLLRGLPLDTNGFFTGTFTFLLNPFALAVGLFAVVALAMHGAAFLMIRLDGPPSERARRAFLGIWGAVLGLYIVVTSWSLLWRGGFGEPRPFVVAVIALSFGALVAVQVARARRQDVLTFLASSAFLALLLIAAAGTMFPYLVPAYPNRADGISIYSVTPSLTGLITPFVLTTAGLIFLIVYSFVAWRRLAVKIRV